MSVAFLWCDKVMTRRIRERVDEPASALAVYLALCEIASDETKQEFIATQAYIASKSGVGVRTVAKRLQDLVDAKIITVETPELKAPSRIRLLPPTGNGCRTLGTGCGTFGNGVRNQLPTLEEREELESPKPPRLLPVPARMALERQAEKYEREIASLRGLRLHQQKPGHAERLKECQDNLDAINRRLADHAQATARA